MTPRRQRPISVGACGPKSTIGGTPSDPCPDTPIDYLNTWCSLTDVAAWMTASKQLKDKVVAEYERLTDVEAKTGSLPISQEVGQMVERVIQDYGRLPWEDCIATSPLQGILQCTWVKSSWPALDPILGPGGLIREQNRNIVTNHIAWQEDACEVLDLLQQGLSTYGKKPLPTPKTPGATPKVPTVPGVAPGSGQSSGGGIFAGVGKFTLTAGALILAGGALYLYGKKKFGRRPSSSAPAQVTQLPAAKVWRR